MATSDMCQFFLAGVLDKVNVLIQFSVEAVNLRVHIQRLMINITIRSLFGISYIMRAGEVRNIHSINIGWQMQRISELLDQAKIFKASLLAQVAHLYDVQ